MKVQLQTRVYKEQNQIVMDKIYEQIRIIYGHYKLALSKANKIDQLQTEIELLLEEKKDDLKGYENALKKLKGTKTIKEGKAKALILEIRKMQKKSIINHYESRVQIENATKEEK